MHIFTDHQDMLYVFAPSALRSNSLRHVLSKVLHRVTHLSRFESFIDHIGGAKNVIVNILSGWSGRYRRTTVLRVAAQHGDIVFSSKD